MTTLMPRSHINKQKCPECVNNLKMSISESDYFVMIWVCLECDFHCDVLTGTEAKPYHPLKELNYSLKWENSNEQQRKDRRMVQSV